MSWLRFFRKGKMAPSRDAPLEKLKVGPSLDYIERSTKTIYEKTRQHGGDPFVEYRTKGDLPEAFEFGMNCLMDHFARVSGEVITQRAYEIIKNRGGYTIIPTRDVFDLPGIPVLFSINDIDIGIEAQNQAIEDVTKQIEDDRAHKKLTLEENLTEQPIFIQGNEGEEKPDRARRLAVISMGLTSAEIMPELLQTGLKGV